MTMPVKLAVATMARLIPPLSIVTIIPMARKAMMGSWYDMEMRFPRVGNLMGLRSDMRSTIADEDDDQGSVRGCASDGRHWRLPIASTLTVRAPRSTASAAGRR